MMTYLTDPKDHGLEEAYTGCLETLERLQIDYLDLYLIHWPAKAKMKAEDPRHAGYRRESWMALEKLHKEGMSCNGFLLDNNEINYDNLFSNE